MLDLITLSGLDKYGTTDMRRARGLIYFEPPREVKTLEYLDENYRNWIGRTMSIAAGRDKATISDFPAGLSPEDPEVAWDAQFGVATMTTQCEDAALDDHYRIQTSCLRLYSTLKEGLIKRSKVEVMGCVQHAVALIYH